MVFAVCAGFQNIGISYTLADGTVIDGMGLVDAVTRAGPSRLIGEVVVQPDHPLPRLTGFENHGGRTTLGSGVAPLGRVITGGGNGADAGSQQRGAQRSTARSATDSSPPTSTAPCSRATPRLADHLLRWIVGDLTPLDSRWEERLRTERLAAGSKTGIAKWVQDRLLARG